MAPAQCVLCHQTWEQQVISTEPCALHQRATQRAFIAAACPQQTLVDAQAPHGGREGRGAGGRGCGPSVTKRLCATDMLLSEYCRSRVRPPPRVFLKDLPTQKTQGQQQQVATIFSLWPRWVMTVPEGGRIAPLKPEFGRVPNGARAAAAAAVLLSVPVLHVLSVIFLMS